MRLINVDAIPENEMNYPVWVCLRKQPTIDAVPVVRCLDCKYKGVLWRETICDHPNGMLHKVKPDDFCSYGQRKEDEHESH